MSDPDGDLAVLLPLLRDPRAWKRARAAQGLGSLARTEALPALALACRDENAVVREAAVEALHRLADPAAAAPLREAVRDRDSGVAGAAVRALAQYPSQIAAGLLLELLAQGPRALRCEIARTFAAWAAGGEKRLAGQALPALRRLRLDTGVRPAQWRAFRLALAELEGLSADHLPRAAGSPEPDAARLPRPADVADPDPAGLPRAGSQEP
jgi:HEAT repeat protein